MEDSHSDQRAAARIACDVPLTILLDGTWRRVTVVDVSRTGVRLQVPLGAIGFDPDAALAEVAQFLEDALPPRVQASFHPERLGDLVSRSLGIVRIALPGGGSGDGVLELGCRLDEPLGEIESAALGLAVPRSGESAGDATRRAVRQPVPRRPRVHVETVESDAIQGLTPLRVVVSTCARRETEPLVGPAEEVSLAGLTVRLREAAGVEMPVDCSDVRPLTVAFSDAYGSSAQVDVLDGEAAVYSGGARLAHVEVEPEASRRALLVGYDFERAPELEERQGLRLV